MMLQLYRQTVLLLIVLIISEISGDCRKTFVIHCEKLKDYLKYESATWRQLIIGNSNYKPNEQSNLADLGWSFFPDLSELEWLAINNQFYDQPLETIGTLYHKKLKYFQLYKNDLNNLHFSLFKFPLLIEFNLVNNNIKQIIGNIGNTGKIDTVDFSENKVSEIKENTFINVQIRELIIRSNQLSSIEANAFNDSLEILNLDHNQLGYIPDDSLENLVHLKVLTMSHNQISLIPKLDFLKSIEKFDFSYNKITTIRTKFQSFPNLKHIDLGHNLIKRINFVSLIPRNEFPKKISIAFNYLTQFELSDEEWQFNFTAPVTLILFGNPWICQCLDEMEVFLTDRPFKRTECDLSLFGNGRFPHCVNQELCVSYLMTFDTSFYENFLDVLIQSKKHYTCNVDDDMLNLQNSVRFYEISGPPLIYRRVGNKYVSSY